MFCQKCGLEVDDSALFCSKCGTKLKTEDKTTEVIESKPVSAYEQKKLEETVSVLYDMELHNYCLKRSIDKLNYDIDNGIYEYKCPPHPRMEQSSSGRSKGSPVSMFLLLVCVGLFILGAAIQNHILLIISLLAGSIAVISVFTGTNSTAKEREAEKVYLRQMHEYKWKVSQAEKKCEEFLVSQRDEMAEKLHNSEVLLAEFYDKSGIDPSFRNILAIGYMNEYIHLNISKKLEGIDGLYYLVKKEIRWDDLSYTLDNISKKLNEVISNQREIYYEIEKMNSKCDQIIAGVKGVAAKIDENTNVLREVKESVDISAYWNERSAKELQYRNIMESYYHSVDRA